MTDKYEKTMKLSIFEGALYTFSFNATQGFVYSTLAMEYGFSPVVLSVIAVLPSTAQIIQLFTPMIYKLIPSKRKAIFWTSLIARSSFIIIPISMLLEIKSYKIIVLPFIVFNILNSIVGNLWTSAMKNIVPEEKRNRYFGFRNTVATFAGLTAWVLFSVILQFLDRKVGLLIIYSLSAGIFIYTSYLLYLHSIPETKVVDFGISAVFSTLKNKKFARFLGFVFVWNFAIQFAGPFFSYFEVSQLKVPYSYLGFLNVINSVLAMFLYTFYGKISTKVGEKNMIRYGITLALAIPLIYSFMTPSNYKYLLIIDVIVTALGWSAINLSYFTLLLKISDEPSENFISLHAFVAGLASLIASYSGGKVLSAIKDIEFGFLTGYNILFMIAFILRIIALIYFIKLNLGEDKRNLRFTQIAYMIVTRRF
ncbi:MFS transporter [Fervidobacterium sp. 2310opik-2]|uniref:MFS transporter n=1 Tax=Fervidobacterium sp. 2310opik-2 TaxID=1755815 RepID=UPI0013DF2B6A|nr:MFS transporter [Fervidobacterium sp. 2310opik-2]KAF2961458.1 MFS transporter [Fervidobacterium sp. 2310opik-2]